MQTAVYRVAQEALANVGRHAGRHGGRASSSRRTTSGVELRVRDDGAGFDPAALAARERRRPGAGLGLSGMAERARLVGGELDVRSAPGGGTTVTLRSRLQGAT